MSFIQAGFLVAIASVSIPVILHLLNRWQVRRIELGTMRFLHDVIREGARRRKIRRWFLLAMRAALLTLLALLFARPFISEPARSDGNRLRVVLIDRSSSMGMPGTSGRLLDDAVGAAADSVNDLGDDATVLWAWFDRYVEPMPSETIRPSAPRIAVGDTNYLAALSWARDMISTEPDAVADVVLVTDMQQTGTGGELTDTQSLAFPSNVPVRIIDVGRPAANNLSINSLAAAATRLDVGSDIVLNATLFNFGSLPFEEIPFTASASNGEQTVRLKKSINIPGGQAEEVALDFGKLDPGIWQVTASIDVEDDLAADNRRLTALEVAQPIEVLALDAGTSKQGVAAESYYLVAALTQSGRESPEDEFDAEQPRVNRGRFGASVVYLQDSSPTGFDAAKHPLVVVVDSGAVSANMIQQLERFVRGGGRLLVFAGDGDGENNLAWWQQSGLAPGELQPPRRSGVMPFRISLVDGRSTMLAPFVDPQHGDLGRLAFNMYLPVNPNQAATVHAEFDRRSAALTEHELDKGRVVWFLSSADASWGNWPTSPLYLPLVQQMASELLNLTGEGPIRFRLIGDDQRLLPTSQTNVKQVSYRQSNNTLQPLTFTQSGFEQRSDALYVVNGSARESDPTRIDVTEFAKRFELSLAQADGAKIIASVQTQAARELWPWLAAAVVVLLIAEFTLANRTST